MRELTLKWGRENMYFVIRKAEKHAVIPERRVTYSGLTPKKGAEHRLAVGMLPGGDGRMLHLSLRPRIITSGSDRQHLLPIGKQIPTDLLPSGALDVREFIAGPFLSLRDGVTAFFSYQSRLCDGLSLLIARVARLKIRLENEKICYELRIGKWEAREYKESNSMRDFYVLPRRRAPRSRY
jgi:hypothetical protein